MSRPWTLLINIILVVLLEAHTSLLHPKVQLKWHAGLIPQHPDASPHQYCMVVYGGRLVHCLCRCTVGFVTLDVKLLDEKTWTLETKYCVRVGCRGTAGGLSC